MWFKNLAIYRVPARWDISAVKLDKDLEAHAFAPGTQLEETSVGWAPVLEQHGGLAYPIGTHLLLNMRQEKKLLPPKVIAQVVKQRAADLEAQDGFKPGRKAMKELREDVRDELLPKAFCITNDTGVWLDPKEGWLVVDCASGNQASDIFGLLARAIDKFPGQPLKLGASISGAMTSWLAEDAAPAGFSIDQDLELRGRDGKAAVRYSNLTAAHDDVMRHIKDDRVCTRLALTWNDRISFVLTDKGEIKRVRPLDVIKESGDATVSGNDAVERFESDMTLMTGELPKLLADLVDALGGFAVAKAA